MTVYTTRTGGNGNDASTWAPNGVPATGDVEDILAGTVVYPSDSGLNGQLVELEGSAGLSFEGSATGSNNGQTTRQTIIRETANAIGTVLFANGLTNAGEIDVAAGASLTIQGDPSVPETSTQEYVGGGRIPYTYRTGNQFANTGTINLTNASLTINAAAGYNDIGQDDIPFIGSPFFGFTNNGTINLTNSDLLVNASTAYSIYLNSGVNSSINLIHSTVEFSGYVSTAGLQSLGGAHVIVDQPAEFHSGLSNAQLGDTIDLKGIAPSSLTAVMDGVTNGDTVKVGFSIPKNTVPTAYNETIGAETFASDGQGGTIVTVTRPDAGSTIYVDPVTKAGVAVVAGARQNYGVQYTNGAPVLTQPGKAQFFDSATSVRFSDGILSFEPTSIYAAINREYQTILGQTADAGGEGYWASQIAAGATTTAGLANALIASPSFAALYASPGDADFITDIVRNATGQTAGAVTISGYEQQLQNGTPRAQLADSIAQSADAVAYTNTALLSHGVFAADAASGTGPAASGGVTMQNGLRAAYSLASVDGSVIVQQPGTTATLNTGTIQFIDGSEYYNPSSTAGEAYRLYQAAFGRAPDAAGLGYWNSALAAGNSLSGVAQGYAASAEFSQRYSGLSNGDYVTALYQNVLGRAGDAAGGAYWQGLLDGGAATRSDVLMGFSESGENTADTASAITGGLFVANTNAVAVLDAYQAVLGHAPDNGGLAYWIGALNGGLGGAGMLNAFIGSAEFNTAAVQSNAGFVGQIIQNAEGAADAGGAAYWTAALNAGTVSRTDVAAAYAQSAVVANHTTPLIGAAGITLTS